jgi:hypothetical protein
MRSSATLAALVLLLVGNARVTAEVVERILAVVDGRPLMLTETRLVERVLGVDRKAALDSLIDERLMYREAARLPQAALTPEEEERAYASLVAKASGRAEGLPEGDLRLMAARQAVILKYVHFRFLPQVRIDDQALRRAYEDELGGRPGAPSFEEAAPALRQRLVDRDLGEKIEAWVRGLRSAADVRYNP